MIYQLQLAVRNDAGMVRNRLTGSFAWLKERGYELVAEEKRCGELSVLSLTLSGSNRSGVFRDNDIIYIFKHQLAEILSESIITEWERLLISQRVEKHFRRLSADEKQALVERSVNFMRRCNENDNLNMILKFGRKTRISQRILEHLGEGSILNVEGLINFGLRDYLKEIRFAVDLAYEDIRNEKQYNEFVKLLKYFVETQTPRVREVNILISENGTFQLWDENGHSIRQELVDFYLEDLGSGDADMDDILISILITLSPRRIVFHSQGRFPGGEAGSTIRRVFQDRIVYCQGCKRCLDRMREN